MWRRHLTRNPSFLVRFVCSFCAAFVLAILLQFATGEGYTALYPFMALFIYLPVSSRWAKWRVKRHDDAMRRFAKEHSLTFAETGKQDFIRELGSIDEIREVEGETIKNMIIGPDWKYGDLAYQTHVLSGSGTGTGVTVYVSVISTKLSRKLPNIVFDSKKARGRQFRFQFARSQVHSLEGDFDKFFVTYFPPDYTIDSMSFITPEVMWAMRDAKDYDIEIYGDRLFLYSSVYAPERQIPDMAAKLLAIKKELADNIDTYRDARVPFAEGRQRVSVKGAKLTASAFWNIVFMILATLYGLFYLWTKYHNWG
jgi:hypothetical protein